MASDSLHVLDELVRTGIWSKLDTLFRFRHAVLEAESVLDFVYRRCTESNFKRLGSSASKQASYLSTLFSYHEAAALINQILDCFARHKVLVLVVYTGKFMEAPLSGLLAAEFTKNTQRVIETIKALVKHNKSSKLDSKTFTRPNLLLILFKQIVSARNAAAELPGIKTFQAYYHAYPLMAKLARDYRCPVVTNSGDFIVLDVRAGFVLLDDVWEHVIKQQQPSASANAEIKLRFHQSLLLLHQHPGLSAGLTLSIFPLTSVDFLTRHSSSLKVLGLYDRVYRVEDFARIPAANAAQIYQRYQSAANRLERVLRFLSGKTTSLLGHSIRGEATRIKSSFDDDFRELFNYYAVAFDFKTRLRLVLKYMDDIQVLEYIEESLLRRDNTSEYLLPLICCSVGRLASINYNSHLQCEDLNTNVSSYSLMNRHKSMLMSLFSKNRAHKGETSATSRKSQDSNTRYSTVSLTVINRRGAEVVEQTVSTNFVDAKLDAIRGQLKLANLARNRCDLPSRIAFINLAFRVDNILKLPDEIKNILPVNVSHADKDNLAILLNVNKYSMVECSIGDERFATSYSKLNKSFVDAILNCFLYTHRAATETLIVWAKKSQAANRIHLESATGSNANTIKHVRHLIELLSSGLEAYYQLNSFFNYPLARLDLHQVYNPILLFNLTVCCLNETNKQVIRLH